MTGWFLSEKLDGVRCYWSGKQLFLRSGEVIQTPDFFKRDLPNNPLDGELYLGKQSYQMMKQIVLNQGSFVNDQLWKKVRFVVFDAPGLSV